MESDNKQNKNATERLTSSRVAPMQVAGELGSTSTNIPVRPWMSNQGVSSMNQKIKAEAVATMQNMALPDVSHMVARRKKPSPVKPRLNEQGSAEQHRLRQLEVSAKERAVARPDVSHMVARR